MDRAQMLALVAAAEALQDAGIEITAMTIKYDVGVVVGSGIGGIVTVVQALQGFQAQGASRRQPGDCARLAARWH